MDAQVSVGGDVQPSQSDLSLSLGAVAQKLTDLGSYVPPAVLGSLSLAMDGSAAVECTPSVGAPGSECTPSVGAPESECTPSVGGPGLECSPNVGAPGSEYTPNSGPEGGAGPH